MKRRWLLSARKDAAELPRALARRKRSSLLAVGELSIMSRGVDNQSLLADLPHHDLAEGAVVAELVRGRAER